MSNIIYLKEVKIKKDLAKAEKALCEARTLVAQGVNVPEGLFKRLHAIINILEDELQNYILSSSH
jgi:hypothetical protein